MKKIIAAVIILICFMAPGLHAQVIVRAGFCPRPVVAARPVMVAPLRPVVVVHPAPVVYVAPPVIVRPAYRVVRPRRTIVVL